MPTDCTVKRLDVMDGARNATRTDHVVEVSIYVVMDHSLDKVGVKALGQCGEFFSSPQTGERSPNVVRAGAPKRWKVRLHALCQRRKASATSDFAEVCIPLVDPTLNRMRRLRPIDFRAAFRRFVVGAHAHELTEESRTRSL